MKENTLLLHIGTPKTGTTALQHFFYDNQELLKKYGWCYPDTKTRIGDVEHYYGGKEKNGDCLYRTKGMFDRCSENYKLAKQYILDCLKDYNTIISAEEIYLWDTEDLIKELKKSWNHIKVIIYLRRQDFFAEANWNQRIKGKECCEEEFIQYIDNIKKNGKIYNYYSCLKQIDEIIGKENIIVRVYEKEQFLGDKQNIVSDFFYAIGLRLDWSLFKEMGYKNERLYGNYVELKRIYNSVLNNQKENISKEKYTGYFMQASESDKSQSKDYYFEKNARVEFLSLFEEQNKLVATEYLKRENKSLFMNNQIEETCNLVKATSFERDLLKIVGTILYKQDYEMQQKISCLEKQNDYLIEMFLMLKKNEKELAYFAAGQKCLELMNKKKFSIALVIDNDEKKAGQYINETPIVCAKEIEDWSKYFIIITCLVTEEIEMQLQERGLKKDKDYILAKDFLY